MNRSKLKAYAPKARRDFIRAVTDRAAYYGLTKKKIEPVTEEGDVAIIAGKPFFRRIATMRSKLESRIKRQGFEQVMEAMAYTWFNRMMAIRFMELHGYLEHGYRVLSHPEGTATPEIIENAEHVDLPGLDKQKAIELKLEGTKESELYNMLFLAQCRALHRAMPFLFEAIEDETELLLPENLLRSDSVIRKMVGEIDEADWQEVEIVGWLYQFYISEKKDEVIGKVVKSEDIPAATQLFTPNWIVKYLVQNSLGRQWVATYPDSPVKGQMEYYIEPAEQTPEVQEQLKAITPESLNPEELTLLDPACGSGHILVEAYDLLKSIYQERGYRAKDIPRLILEKNLFGLEIDDRAAQLAAFALLMKARADDRRIFAAGVQPHVLAIQESKGLDAREIAEALNQPIFKGEAPPPESLFEEIDDEKAPLFSRKNLSEPGQIPLSDVAQLIALFEHGKTFGSLIEVPEKLAARLPAIAERVQAVTAHGGMLEKAVVKAVQPLIRQAGVLAKQYDAVAMNPPYMGSGGMTKAVKAFAKANYAHSRADLFAMFIERGCTLASESGVLSMITMQSWMFLSSFAELRRTVLLTKTLQSMAHLGPRAFSSISGEVVTVTSFALLNRPLDGYKPTFLRLVNGDEREKANALASKAGRITTLKQQDFSHIPGMPVAYWIGPGIRSLFQSGKLLRHTCQPLRGVETGNNERFLKSWVEVDYGRIGIGCTPSDVPSDKKWFPYNKGGEFCKWYGNRWLVIDWENDGFNIKNQYYPKGSRLPWRATSSEHYFHNGITWGGLTSATVSFRLSDYGAIFDSNKGAMVFPPDSIRNLVLGVLNSNIAGVILRVLNPTLSTQNDDVGNIPFDPETLEPCQERISGGVSLCVRRSREAECEFETCWDFQLHPLIASETHPLTIEAAYNNWKSRAEERFNELHAMEVQNNRLLIETMGLQQELSPDVPEDQITLYRPDREEDIKRLISYAIGCMMGRYSLDKTGLIYAHCGNRGFDSSQYKRFAADQDGIIPVTDTDWFPDDAANRVVEFIATAWPKEHLEENLKFVAESLGPKRGESPRDTIRRYLSQGFYKHHLSMYKKRPIYWLFSSGKQRAFECLVYWPSPGIVDAQKRVRRPVRSRQG